MAAPELSRLLVVDSSSADGTVERARELGADVHRIPRDSFGHGATRELARRMLGTDAVVMVTQDAIARSPEELGRLVAGLEEERVAVAYGRQVARTGADPIEAFGRRFSYPQTSHVRGLEDAPCHGPYLTFCSNAFAAWRQDALDAVGGFPTVTTHEDAIAAALLLRAGHRIAYVAEAVVEHSHALSMRDEFRRYRAAGRARAAYRAVLDVGGAGDQRVLGRRYAEGLLRELAAQAPWLIPRAVGQLAARLLGYRVGAAGTA